MDKATHYGIETRRISEVTQEEMIGWLKISEIIHVIYFPELATVKMELHCPAGETDGMLHPSVIEKIRAGKGDTPVFIRHTDGVGFRAAQLLDAAIRKGLNIFQDVPIDGTKIRKQLIVNFAKGLFWIQTIAGPRDKLIIGVDVHGEVRRPQRPIRIFATTGSANRQCMGSRPRATSSETQFSFHCTSKLIPTQ